jgi:hypothetical protein
MCCSRYQLKQTEIGLQASVSTRRVVSVWQVCGTALRKEDVLGRIFILLRVTDFLMCFYFLIETISVRAASHVTAAGMSRVLASLPLR